MLEQNILSSNFPTTNLDGHLQCNIKFKYRFLPVTQSHRKIKKPPRGSNLRHAEREIPGIRLYPITKLEYAGLVKDAIRVSVK